LHEEALMNRKTLVITLIIILALCFAFRAALAVEKIPPDERAVRLINQFMTAISNPDEQARLAAVVPLVHKSMLTRDGKDLDDNVKPFSYKKACQNVGCYKIPVGIKYVLKGNNIGVGFQETAERGRIDRYFVVKKDGVAGMPAPIHIFWPDSGGEPTIIDFGSL
jgi:hypothetical protein